MQANAHLVILVPYSDVLQCYMKVINPLPNDKILNKSKLKAFADEKMKVAEKLKFVLGRVENIVGKGGNAGLMFSLHLVTESNSNL